jgi:replication factor C subunit 2/4
MQVAQMEGLEVEERGYEALIYTAEGDMRQALNNLQATAAGFGKVTFDSVFLICDQPHPEIIRDILQFSLSGQFSQAAERLNLLWAKGYSPFDIAGSLYKVASDNGMTETMQLAVLKELAVLRMRLLDGVCSLLQFHGCLAKLCELQSA